MESSFYTYYNYDVMYNVLSYILLRFSLCEMDGACVHVCVCVGGGELSLCY